MDKKEFKIYNNSIEILKRKKYIKTNLDILDENFKKKTLYDYFNHKYLSK